MAMGGKSNGGRRRRLLVFVMALALVVALALWLKPWAASVMRVTITISTDDGGPTEVYRKQIFFPGQRTPRPVVIADIDLTRWAGRLIRFDVQGEVEGRIFPERALGHPGCSAALVDAAGSRPLEFVGYKSEYGARFHIGDIGCLAYVAPVEADPPFVFTTEDSLWHAMRVPEGARLRLSLTPVLDSDLGWVVLHNRFSARPEVFAPRQDSPPASLIAPPRPNGVGRPPDVFIYLIDALRADHLGCYGYDRETSPEIDAFAASTTRYEQAQTSASWTRPAVATLLTGLYPSLHGVMHSQTDKLDEWPVLLSEALHDAGYSTWSVTTNGNSSEVFGFDQSYDGFMFSLRDTAEWVNGRVERILSGLHSDRPVFMYLHTLEPHLPYTPKPESFRRFDRGLNGACDGSLESIDRVGRLNPEVTEEDVGYLMDLYDAEVFDADQGFAGFLNVLRRAGRLEDSLIVLVADHGESFLEHGTLGHGHNLNQEEMRVPLIVRFPEREFDGVRVDEQVSLVDVFPTVLRQAGVSVELNYPLPGRDITPGSLQFAPSASSRLYAELSKWEQNPLDLVGVIDEGGYKRVFDMSSRRGLMATESSIGLWDTSTDPSEQNNLTASLPVRAAYDEQLVARWLVLQRAGRGAAAPGAPARAEMNDELRRELQALGYLTAP